MDISAVLIATLLIALLAIFTVFRAVRIVPQSRARNVERLGRYHRTLQPGLNFVIPYIDRVHRKIDLREQVVSFQPQPVITEDNLVVEIDTVLYFQVTDPRAAAYEIASYLQAVEQLTVTTLRNVVGSMDLEKTLTSRDAINSQLRGVLDDATGKWGLRVNRVEIKAIDPPPTIKDAMEKQMRAERAKRAAILSAEGQRQSQILTAEGDKQAAVLRAEGNRTARVLKAEGEAKAIEAVFQAVHRNDANPKLLAYQYLQTLPKLAEGPNNTFFVIPSEVTTALQGVSRAFTETLPKSSATPDTSLADGVDHRAADDAAQATEAAAEAAAEAATDASKAGAVTDRSPSPAASTHDPIPTTDDSQYAGDEVHPRGTARTAPTAPPPAT